MGKVGENMMIAGVFSQIANMLVCGSLMVACWRRYREVKCSAAEKGVRSPKLVHVRLGSFRCPRLYPAAEYLQSRRDGS